MNPFLWLAYANAWALINTGLAVMIFARALEQPAPKASNVVEFPRKG